MRGVPKAVDGAAAEILLARLQEQGRQSRHQSYSCQQARGLRRKCLLIAEAGGRCTRCGYSGNLAALTWHHLDPAKKSFNLDMRALSNRSDGEVRAELAKCVLLCANCHAEEHFPDLRVMGPP